MGTQIIKPLIHQKLKTLLDEKIAESNLAIASTRESMLNETKSSAGDKHETGRAMMQIEMAQNEAQLEKAVLLQREFEKIDTQKEYDKVETGSLVFTNRENYFISIGLGKILVDGEIYFAISIASPIGQAMKGKDVGDTVLFGGREIVIEGIC